MEKWDTIKGRLATLAEEGLSAKRGGDAATASKRAAIYAEAKTAGNQEAAVALGSVGQAPAAASGAASAEPATAAPSAAEKPPVVDAVGNVDKIDKAGKAAAATPSPPPPKGEFKGRMQLQPGGATFENKDKKDGGRRIFIDLGANCGNSYNALKVALRIAAPVVFFTCFG